jgi:hypothetical protein
MKDTLKSSQITGGSIPSLAGISHYVHLNLHGLIISVRVGSNCFLAIVRCFFNVSTTITNHPYVDGLYHPFIVKFGGGTNIHGNINDNF